MIPPEDLKNVLAKTGYSRQDLALIALAATPLQPRAVKAVRSTLVDSGQRQARNWNVSRLLGSQPELAVRTVDGWELTGAGESRVADLVGTKGRRTRKTAAGLRHHLASIKDADTRAFVEEAVECLESGLLRSAVVLSWIGAVAVLQDTVIAQHLDAFNAEAIRRDAKWRAAKVRDDLARMKEYDFLQILSAISAIGKSVKVELEQALKLRNGCGHPNSLKVGEARVAAHVETLILNVFAARLS